LDQLALGEVVDHDHHVGRIRGQAAGELAQRARARGKAAQQLHAQVAHAERLADRVAAVGVEDERGERAPGVGRGVGRGHAATMVARLAVASAHAVVVASPTNATSTPQPAMIHQPAWLASAKPAPREPATPAAVAAPTIATPSDCPTWRLVDAI